MTVLVFKTNLTPDDLQKRLAPKPPWLIDGRWSIEWEDCDRVLRIESPTVPAATIEDELRAMGIDCQELD